MASATGQWMKVTTRTGDRYAGFLGDRLDNDGCRILLTPRNPRQPVCIQPDMIAVKEPISREEAFALYGLGVDGRPLEESVAAEAAVTEVARASAPLHVEQGPEPDDAPVGPQGEPGEDDTPIEPGELVDIARDVIESDAPPDASEFKVKGGQQMGSGKEG